MKNENNYNKKSNIENYTSRKKEKLFILTDPNYDEQKIFSKTTKNFNNLFSRVQKIKKYSQI